MQRFLWLVVSAVLLGLVGCGSSQGVISKAKYDLLTDGMSYAEVVAVVGREGKYKDGMEVMGVSTSIRIYEWRNKDGTRAQLTFQNDKLTEKDERGLQ